MRVPLNWLRDFVSVEAAAEELADRLTMAGVAVDTVLHPGAEIKKVVSGRLLAVERHPDADRLVVCRVDTGAEPLTIVTGAPNVAAGQIVPVALHGSRLAGGKSIKQSRLRGVLSQGMLCSGQELGMDGKLLSPEEQHGILILPPDTPVGLPVTTLMAMDDAVLVLDLTPNRGDCLSVYGVAREVAVLYGLPLKPPPTDLPAPRGGPGVAVTIADAGLCRRYVARPVSGAKTAPSPAWLAGRLRLAGVRPISNIVDVTNYVMLEMGQPLHAFDAHRIRDGHITVRLARTGEEIVSLDGVTRHLDDDMLLITDGGGPVAIAGVMGGLDSEITADTQDVVLESASFDPVSVRRTSRRLGLRSEASQRFEKGVDPAGCLTAADRAAHLILSLAGGTVLAPVDDYPAPAKRRTIALSPARVNDLVGVAVPERQMQDFLTALGAEVHAGSGEWLVDVPTWRPDLAAECDLVEEVARLYGYMNLPETMPEGPTAQGGLPAPARERRLLARTMAGCGLREVLTMSLVSRTALSPFGGEGALPLLNPLSEEQAVLRTSLLPGLTAVLVKNFNRQVRDMAVFELGTIFLPRTGEKLPAEGDRLAAAAMGTAPAHWRGPRVPYDFYYLKGAVLAAFRALGLPEPALSPRAFPGFHPGRTAAVALDGTTVGCVGELHPAYVAGLGLTGSVAALELDLDEILDRTTARAFTTWARFPAVERDLAVVVRREIPAAAVLNLVRRLGGSLLKDVALFDVYEGDKIPSGSRSLACRLVFQAADRTLTDDEAATAVQAVVKGLAGELQARLRS